VIIVNPASDSELAEIARGLVAEGDWTPETLQANLRLTYPKVVVHRRELSGEQVDIYYVYRDGRWIPPDPLDQSPPNEADIDAAD